MCPAVCPAVCSPQAAGTEAVLFTNNDLERPVADAMGSPSLLGS